MAKNKKICAVLMCGGAPERAIRYPNSIEEIVCQRCYEGITGHR